MNTLNVNLNNVQIGTLYIDSTEDRYMFTYTKEWEETGYEISPYLPFNHDISSGTIKRFLENLLPEGKGLDDLTAFTHISKNNIFGLIQAIGFETSGALNFGDIELYDTPLFRPISKKELTTRIDEIERKSIIIWDQQQRLSLSGVQEKLPVLLKEGEIGLANGSLSSTHILKFQAKRNEHIVINEFFCMSLAKVINLPVAPITLQRYGVHPVLMVERFDRIVKDKKIERVHIIDGCQMLDLAPAYKYERNFGSGRDVKDIREGASFSKLFKTAEICQIPATAKLQLLEWAIFNLIIGNSDAHGKNISYFVNNAGFSIAPHYDMLSILMHEGIDHDLAMAFGDEFNPDKVLGYPLREFCDDIQINPKLVSSRISLLCNKVKSALDDCPIDKNVLNNDEKGFIVRLEKLISQRVTYLLEANEEMQKVSF